LLYVNGYRSYAGTTRRIEVQENLRYAMSWMAREIRQARDLTVYGPDGNPADAGPVIRFTLPDGNQVTYQYDAVQREVETKRSEGDTPHPVASNVSGLEFRCDPARRTVTITITGEKWDTGPVTVRTQVRPRAT
ncbi:MAG: hypothetical protein H5T97_11050, partial [Firmicutes bacterium]|nr:hypothetical protein [Bacillota bacterium]